jgi:hypothetical protein
MTFGLVVGTKLLTRCTPEQSLGKKSMKVPGGVVQHHYVEERGVKNWNWLLS